MYVLFWTKLDRNNKEMIKINSTRYVRVTIYSKREMSNQNWMPALPPDLTCKQTFQFDWHSICYFFVKLMHNWIFFIEHENVVYRFYDGKFICNTHLRIPLKMVRWFRYCLLYFSNCGGRSDSKFKMYPIFILRDWKVFVFKRTTILKYFFAVYLCVLYWFFIEKIYKYIWWRVQVWFLGVRVK